MKKLAIMFMLTLFITILGGCGNDEKEKIFIDMTYEIFEFPIVDNAPNQKPEIHVGKRYVLYFNVDLTNLTDTLSKKFLWREEESAEVTIRVSLGELDDTEINLINSINTPDGAFKYNNLGNGIWEAKFVVTKGSAPDFSKTPFNIWIDTIGLDLVNTQLITVSMETENKRIIINNSDDYAITLQLKAGDFEFTKENLTQYSDFTARLTIPKEASNITFIYYTSSNKNISVGQVNYLNTGEPLLFDFAEHLAKLYYNVVEPTTQQVLTIRNKIINNEYDNYYLRIEADGGKNYINQIFEFNPFLTEEDDIIND
ncbi:hypothetical protein [Liberiplasma polymorphum]|uniref:hypothetical protein n=1 Tax=Liberiplasma polymorphum TaxID=3374570 RepID=UPI003773AABF